MNPIVLVKAKLLLFLLVCPTPIGGQWGGQGGEVTPCRHSVAGLSLQYGSSVSCPVFWALKRLLSVLKC